MIGQLTLSETAIRVTVEHLVVLVVALSVASTLVIGWLFVVGYRAYGQHGTRLIKFATAGLGLLVVGRVLGFLTGWWYLVGERLTVIGLLEIQIARSVVLVAGFCLIGYALVTRG